MTTTGTRRVLARSDEIERTIARIAHEMLEPQEVQRGLVLLGVRRGGEALAIRLAREIERIRGISPVLGSRTSTSIATTKSHASCPSRKSLSTSPDASWSWSTTCWTPGGPSCSALDAVTDLGRPAAIRLCVLVDRGLRELPIQPDYVGRRVATSDGERVEVRLATEPVLQMKSRF